MDTFLNGMLKMLRIECVPTGTVRTETNRAGRTSSYRQVQAICAELTDLHAHYINNISIWLHIMVL